MADQDTTSDDRKEQNDTEGHRLMSEADEADRESQTRTNVHTALTPDEPSGASDDVQGHKFTA